MTTFQYIYNNKRQLLPTIPTVLCTYCNTTASIYTAHTTACPRLLCHNVWYDRHYGNMSYHVDHNRCSHELYSVKCL